MFAEDLSVFFEQKDFAVEAVVTLTNASTCKISVIFDKQIQAIDLLETSIAANTPNFLCKTSDLVGVSKRGAAVSISSVSYIIERIEDDGNGTSTVYLRNG